VTAPRTIRYREIAGELAERVGALGAGHLLPSEGDLSREFGASRVTVRRALEVLRDDGLVESRQGFGWFAAGAPLPQRLGRLATIEEQMEERGVHAERRVLELAVEDAPAHVRTTLGAARVLRVRRLNLADGEPFGVVTVWCPAALGAHLTRDDVERAPFYELLDVPLKGATQTIGADAASPAEAATLDILPGSPVLRCARVTLGPGGKPVLMSEHVFPAHRTEFVVDLPFSEPLASPHGLRLVE
jgi:GntR family transcriptional regulator